VRGHFHDNPRHPAFSKGNEYAATDILFRYSCRGEIIEECIQRLIKRNANDGHARTNGDREWKGSMINVAGVKYESCGLQIMDTGWPVKDDPLSALMSLLSGFFEAQEMSNFLTPT
jgi:hypothetical protein